MIRFGCRAGLYKQLATLKGLVEEYRENPEGNQTLRAPIVQNLAQTGLDQDCPFKASSTSAESTSEPELLTPECAEGVSEDDFSEYVSSIYQYLQVIAVARMHNISKPIQMNICTCFRVWVQRGPTP